MLRIIVCVLPDGQYRSMEINPDYKIDLQQFCSTLQIDGYSLYCVTPSWIDRLPKQGEFRLASEFVTHSHDFRLHFLPDVTPKHIVKLYPKANVDLKFVPWNIVIPDGSKITFNDILRDFQRKWWLEAESFAYTFETNNWIENVDADLEILAQGDILRYVKVTVNVEISGDVFVEARKRLAVMAELRATEKQYIHLLTGVERSFTPKLFNELNIDPGFYARTFRAITEITPRHNLFMDAIKRAGVGVEASYGRVFIENMHVFLVAAPHVQNFKRLRGEIDDLLNTDKEFYKSAQRICEKEFNGSETMTALLIAPVQRIPRYPLLLKELLHRTSAMHWDREDVVTAIEKMNGIVNMINDRTHEQEQLNFVADLQQEIGDAYKVMKTSRKGLMALDNVQVNKKYKASLYLFSDIILYRTYQPQKFAEFSLLSVDVVHANKNMIIDNRISIPESEKTLDFFKLFRSAKRQLISKMATFGNALVWNIGISGPHNVSAPGFTDLNDVVYVFGGRGENGKAASDLWKYDGREWSCIDGINRPAGRYGCTMHAYNNKLFVFGGRSGKIFFNEVLVFNIETSKWLQIEARNAPEARSGHSSAFLGTEVWIFGGRLADGRCVNDIYIFDVGVYSWRKVDYIEDEYPEPRSHTSTFWTQDADGKFYLAIHGGAQGKRMFDDLWFYSRDDSLWMQMETKQRDGVPTPGARCKHVSVIVDDYVYVFGGVTDSSRRPSTYRLDISEYPSSWVELPQMDEPETFVGGRALVSSGLIFLFGGQSEAHPGVHLWTIKLRETAFAQDCQTSNQNPSLTLSRPLYDPKSETVTSAVNDPSSTFVFDMSYDEKSHNDIRKVHDKQYWRQIAMLQENGKPDTRDTMNNFILSETSFALLDATPGEIVASDGDGDGAGMIPLSDFKKWADPGRRLRRYPFHGLRRERIGGVPSTTETESESSEASGQVKSKRAVSHYEPSDRERYAIPVSSRKRGHTTAKRVGCNSPGPERPRSDGVEVTSSPKRARRVSADDPLIDEPLYGHADTYNVGTPLSGSVPSGSTHHNLMDSVRGADLSLLWQ